MQQRKFLLIFLGGEPPTDPARNRANIKAWADWINSLSELGIYQSGEGLLPEAVRLSGPAGKEVQQGPFSGSLRVSGFALILASGIEDAKRIASGCPILDISGVVEVRPVIDTATT